MCLSFVFSRKTAVHALSLPFSFIFYIVFLRVFHLENESAVWSNEMFLLWTQVSQLKKTEICVLTNEILFRILSETCIFRGTYSFSVGIFVHNYWELLSFWRSFHFWLQCYTKKEHVKILKTTCQNFYRGQWKKNQNVTLTRYSFLLTKHQEFW